MRDAPDGRAEQLEHCAIGTRLGEGLRERGQLLPAAVERTLAAVEEFVARTRAWHAAPACIATSALRRAENAPAFAQRIRVLTGADLRVLDGAEEAACSYRGATYGAPADGLRRAVLDVGGGSTECAVGTDGRLAHSGSVEIGSVRITERFPDLAGGAPGEAARRAACAARAAIAAELAWLAEFRPVAEVRCVAGTALTIGAVAFESDVAAVSGRRLSTAVLDAVVERLLDLPLVARKEMPGMLPQRADVLAGGGLVVSEALHRLGVWEARLESDDLLLGYLLGTR